MSNPTNKYRYPGINAFEETQKDRFHGRSAESEQLCALLTQEKLTILFGKSGYGKTSLLNAGVRPLLLEKNAKSKRRYYPVSIRFNAFNGEETLLEKFKRQFGQAAATIGMVPASHGVALPDTLWGIVRSHAFPAGSPAAVFVLLFDQFEEFFTYPPEQQQDFKDQLAELLYTDYPHFLEQNEALLQADQIAALAEPLDLRALFGIRADRMHELNRLTDRLDKILHNLYELHALPRAEAEKAILLPAALPQSEGFVGAPFAFDRSALDRILDFLVDTQGRVEANQLQILCDSFEQRTIAERITRFGTDNLGDLQQVISNYYHHKIADIHPPETRFAVQRLCEEGLAMEGEPPLRLSLHEAQIARLFGVPPTLLLQLVDLRLLRAEAGAGGGAVYELPHDTLLLPVLEAKRVRQEEMAAAAERVAAAEALRRAQELEAQAAEERRRAEEAERLKNEAITAQQLAEDEKKKAQKMTYFAIGLAGLASLATLGAGYLYDQADKEKTAAQNERNNALKSDSLAQVARKEAIEKSIAAQRSDSLAQINLTKAKIEEARAKAALEKAKTEEAKAKAALEKANAEEAKAKAALEKANAAEQAKQKTEIIRLLNDADTYIRAKLFKNARAKLEAVLKLDPDNREAAQKLKQLK